MRVMTVRAGKLCYHLVPSGREHVGCADRVAVAERWGRAHIPSGIEFSRKVASSAYKVKGIIRRPYACRPDLWCLHTLRRLEDVPLSAVTGMTLKAELVYLRPGVYISP